MPDLSQYSDDEIAQMRALGSHDANREAQRREEADDAGADTLRRSEYDRLLKSGPRGMSDLALRGAAQHAQAVGDGTAERAADGELERRGQA